MRISTSEISLIPHFPRFARRHSTLWAWCRQVAALELTARPPLRQQSYSTLRGPRRNSRVLRGEEILPLPLSGRADAISLCLIHSSLAERFPSSEGSYRHAWAPPREIWLQSEI